MNNYNYDTGTNVLSDIIYQQQKQQTKNIPPPITIKSILNISYIDSTYDSWKPFNKYDFKESTSLNYGNDK